MPDGYTLDYEKITHLRAQYKFIDASNNYIWFEQSVLSGSDFIVDSESGYSKIEEIKLCDVYYRYTGENFIYLWNDDKYSLSLKSTEELSKEELVLIFDGITTE